MTDLTLRELFALHTKISLEIIIRLWPVYAVLILVAIVSAIIGNHKKG